MIKQFIDFLKEYNVVALAIAFIMGVAATSLIQSLVNDIIMPLLAPILSGDSWKTATLDFGQVHIAYGSFLGQLINFIILALIVFIVAKKVLKMEGVK